MAYAALASLAQTLEQIMINVDQYSVLLCEKRLISLHDHVIFLKAFFENFYENASSVEGRIRDVANEAADILEYIVYDQIHSLASGGKFKAHKFRNQFQKLPKLTEDIDSMAEEVMAIKNNLRVPDLRHSHDSSSPISSSSTVQLSESSPKSSSTILMPTKDDTMVGFDDDLTAIKARLCGEPSKLEVIPIVGMGGIGKTTLARNAFDDPLTVEKFDIRAWVTVSQDYSFQQVLFSLLKSINPRDEVFNEKKLSYKRMTERVFKNLKRRKYLIVMDDMWSPKAWDDVRSTFPDDGNGSRIILTTRLLDVAAYPSSPDCLHKIQLMDVVQSWNLLRQKVFKQEQCPPELEIIGKKIVRSCGGLPLAIIVTAGLLSMICQTKASWENFAEKINLSAANDEQCAKILDLSYNHLPYHLRACFLYMGAFPEDYMIDASKLNKLWVAEGFLRPSGSKSPEEGAEEYLEDLVKRSLVLVTKRKYNGKIKSCSLHDLVRDLCIRKGQEEKFLLHNIDKVLPGSTKNLHRLSIIRTNISTLWTYEHASYYCPVTRTILQFDRYKLPHSIDRLKLLRVFDAGPLKFLGFPTEVLELFLLRYLAFRCEDEFIIPSSILRLQNLQTFILRSGSSSYKSIYFPQEIWRMAQLRHVFLPLLAPLFDPCSRSSALENLQTLSLAKNFPCTERILQMIPNLKTLRIFYDARNPQKWSTYPIHNLVLLHQLENLSIRIRSPGCCPVLLWENLAFPISLKKLSLYCCLLSRQDMEIIGSLPNLEKLKLVCCGHEDAKWITTEGEFPQLKFLALIGPYMHEWIIDGSPFPRLEHLLLSEMGPCEVPEGIVEIPTLQLIEMLDSDYYLMEWGKRIKEEQQSFGNDSLQVRIGGLDYTDRFISNWMNY